MRAHLGIFSALAAFLIWGSSPIYWKQLAHVAPMEILCHRMLWSLVLTYIFVLVLGRGRKVFQILKEGNNFKVFFFSSILMAANWTLYIWAINAGYVVEASLGYFINPLMNICCGFFFFHERLRQFQWLAIGIAVLAVVYLTYYYGSFPWIAITLAVCFAIYAVVHKRTSVSALDSLFLETMLLAPAALAYIVWGEVAGHGSLFSTGLSTTILLIGAGCFTTIPLLCFGYAAQRLPLSTLGLIQYISPSLSLIIGIFLYNEDFSPVRMVGFVMIWTALALYVLEGFYFRNRQKRRLARG